MLNALTHAPLRIEHNPDFLNEAVPHTLELLKKLEAPQSGYSGDPCLAGFSRGMYMQNKQALEVRLEDGGQFPLLAVGTSDSMGKFVSIRMGKFISILSFAI